MIIHNIPSNTTVEEVIQQVLMDPNATEREKFFAAEFEAAVRAASEESPDFD